MRKIRAHYERKKNVGDYSDCVINKWSTRHNRNRLLAASNHGSLPRLRWAGKLLHPQAQGCESSSGTSEPGSARHTQTGKMGYVARLRENSVGGWMNAKSNGFTRPSVTVMKGHIRRQGHLPRTDGNSALGLGPYRGFRSCTPQRNPNANHAGQHSIRDSFVVESFRSKLDQNSQVNRGIPAGRSDPASLASTDEREPLPNEGVPSTRLCPRPMRCAVSGVDILTESWICFESGDEASRVSTCFEWPGPSSDESVFSLAAAPPELRCSDGNEPRPRTAVEYQTVSECVTKAPHRINARPATCTDEVFGASNEDSMSTQAGTTLPQAEGDIAS